MTTPQADDSGRDDQLPAGASAIPSATLPSAAGADEPRAPKRDDRPGQDEPAPPAAQDQATQSQPRPQTHPSAAPVPSGDPALQRLGAGGLATASTAQPSRASSGPATGPDGTAATRRQVPPRSGPPRPAPSRGSRPPESGRPPSRSRRAKLALQRIDPWSVFVFSLVASLFLGVALVVAVAALYSVLNSLGVLASVNELYVEVVGGDAGADPLFTSRRFLGGAAVLAAVNVVLLTLLATLGSLLYNLCASFTGGVEVTLGERE